MTTTIVKTRTTSAPTIAGKYLEHLEDIELVSEAFPPTLSDMWSKYRNRMAPSQPTPSFTPISRYSPPPPGSPPSYIVSGPYSQGSPPPPLGPPPPPGAMRYNVRGSSVGMSPPPPPPPIPPQYGRPIGPEPDPGSPRGSVNYDYSRMPGGRPPPGIAQDYGIVAAAVPVGIWRGIKHVAPKIGPGIEHGIETGLTRIIQPRIDAHKLAKETKAALSGRLGVAPPRIVNDIIRLKQRYIQQYGPEKAKRYVDMIDALAKEAENQVQDWDYGERQAFAVQAATIQQRYKQIGKKMARAQGRQEGWRVLRAAIPNAMNTYTAQRDRARGVAQDVRDRELQARSGQIQKHIRDVDRFRDQFVDRIQREVEQQARDDRARPATTAGVTGESLQLQEGKARNFREIMRNKAKVRDRHLLALKRGTVTTALEREEREGRRGRGKKKRGRNPLDPPTITRRVGRKTTLAMRKSRQRHQLLRRKMESLVVRVVNEAAYYGKHPIMHAAGQVTSAPVQLPYRAARGVMRFTGLNELPDIAREKHRELKHQFVHDFLLR